MPASMIAAINSDVPTGRRMKGSETFIAPLHRCASRSLAYALSPAGRGLRGAELEIKIRTLSPARGACHRAGHFGPDPLARDPLLHGERVTGACAMSHSAGVTYCGGWFCERPEC